MARLIAVLAGIAALVPVPAASAATRPHSVAVGIGDQKTEMFADRRFKALGIRYARLTVPWDALQITWQRQELERWLFAARVTGVEPLITFSHSRRPGKRRVLPREHQMAYYFALFRKRYPWVRNFAVWNEANHCGEPTCHRVGRVVAYYKTMRRICPRCKILAAELLDFPNMSDWVREFRRRAHVDPKYWGLHNYRDANRLETRNTRRLLRATRGYVWLTETGGIVNRRNKSSVGFTESPRHAAVATRWVFDHIVPLSSRIQRVYLYHWNASSRLDTWDSALIGPDNRARPALAVLRRVIELGVRPPAQTSRKRPR